MLSNLIRICGLCTDFYVRVVNEMYSVVYRLWRHFNISERNGYAQI